MFLKKYKTQLLSLPFIPLLIEIKKWWSKPLQFLCVLNDYNQTKKDWKNLKETKETKTEKTAILASSIGDFIYEAKCLAMYGLALRLAGFQVKILTSYGKRWQNRYFKAMGFNKLIFWEDILTTNDQKKDVKNNIDSFLKKELTFPKIKTWTYKNSLIGPTLLSQISRPKHKSYLDFTDPQVINQMKNLLPELLLNVYQGINFIKNETPDLILSIEINGTHLSPMIHHAINNNIDVIQAVQPNRDDAIIFKRLNHDSLGSHPNSISIKTLNQFNEDSWDHLKDQELMSEMENRYNGKWFLQKRNQPKTIQKSKESIIKELDLDPNKKIATVFSHVLWDANLFYGTDIYTDYAEWFEETVKLACKNSSVNWLIKMHPANLWKRAMEGVETEYSETKLIRDKIGSLPNHVKLLTPDTEISTLSLFEIIDFAITVRGTSGFEAPIFGIKTITAGTGRYSNLGFTMDAKNIEEYENILLDLHNLKQMSEQEILRAKIHTYIVLKQRPWVYKSFLSKFNYLKKGSHPLDHNLFPVVKQIKDLKHDPSFIHLIEWINNKNEVDFLEKSL